MTVILETSWSVAFGGPRDGGWLPAGAVLPAAEQATVKLRITRNQDGFFLYSESDNPNFCGGDTCHQSAEEAMAQAEFQFGVPPNRWQRVDA